MFAKTVLVAAFAGLVSSQYTSAATYGTSSYNPGPVPTTTKVVDQYVTYCPVPTMVTMNEKVYTVTKPTTLTITDCPCTVTEPCYTCAPDTYSSPQPTGNSYGGGKKDDSKPEYKPEYKPETTPYKPDNKKPVEVAGADARHIAYGLAMAAAGVVGYVALL
ncbi:Cell wall protein SED1 [Ophiocordyceps camponoti-floridani]|uniref:Cell wall protein SED1 n=1 Tax=Ophiocordyceps camponoti-floridani TaxID=2030778 RepID=A0A8H4VFR6_9HYPO|nr:Cell wall protein SED1 [Ophiocordyceps camponoti-floridani]